LAVAKALDCFVSHLVIISKLSQEVYFRSDIQFKYRRMNGVYNQKEQENLTRMGCVTKPITNFTKDVFYECAASIEGQIHAPNKELIAQYSLNKGRKVELQSITYTDKKDYGELLGLPLALAIDAITLPVQLLFTGGALLKYKNSQSKD
ncbi:hypothetical protein, partial [Acinetobacter sp. c3-l95]|uniref:hypothetical protein n=1 Tax=Acinetobacter sp. c3-l95 TaxID=3342804 RepID=UPI0035BA3097